MIYRKYAAKNDAACRNTSQMVKVKMLLFQHLLVFQSWYNVASNETQKLSCDKINLSLNKTLPGVSTCHTTLFQYL